MHKWEISLQLGSNQRLPWYPISVDLGVLTQRLVHPRVHPTAPVEEIGPNYFFLKVQLIAFLAHFGKLTQNILIFAFKCWVWSKKYFPLGNFENSIIRLQGSKFDMDCACVRWFFFSSLHLLAKKRRRFDFLPLRLKFLVLQPIFIHKKKSVS